MKRNPEVDAWFESLDHPLADVMVQVRDTILETDDRGRRDDQVEEPDVRGLVRRAV